MAERAALYHRRFSHKKITATQLAQFYKQHSITRKAIRKTKGTRPSQMHELPEMLKNAWEPLIEALAHGEKVIYVDEVAFTKQTWKTLEYFPKY